MSFGRLLSFPGSMVVSREKQDLHLTGRGEASTMHYPLLAVVREELYCVDKKDAGTFSNQTLWNLKIHAEKCCHTVCAVSVYYPRCVWFLPLIAPFVSQTLCERNGTYKQKRERGSIPSYESTSSPGKRAEMIYWVEIFSQSSELTSFTNALLCELLKKKQTQQLLIHFMDKRMPPCYELHYLLNTYHNSVTFNQCNQDNIQLISNLWH